MRQTVSMLEQFNFLVSAKDDTESLLDSHSNKLWLSCTKEAGQEDLS
jgi:hypothetical protein